MRMAPWSAGHWDQLWAVKTAVRTGHQKGGHWAESRAVRSAKHSAARMADCLAAEMAVKSAWRSEAQRDRCWGATTAGRWAAWKAALKASLLAVHSDEPMAELMAAY